MIQLDKKKAKGIKKRKIIRTDWIDSAVTVHHFLVHKIPYSVFSFLARAVDVMMARTNKNDVLNSDIW